MMLRNIFLKTLRDNRVGVFGLGVGLATIMVIGAASYPQFLMGTEADRARAIAEMAKALRAFSFITGEVTSLETIGGFITSRMLGSMTIFLGLWAVVVGSGLIRGEEEQGALDMLLSAPNSRLTAFTQKVAALVVALAVTVALSGSGLWLGTLVAGEPVALGNLLLTLVNVFAIALFWGSLGLLAGQIFGSRRKASAAVGTLLFVTYILNNIFESSEALERFAWLMPFHYYSLSKPLAPDRGFELGAWLVLVSLAVLTLLLAALFFVRRDIGSTCELIRLGNGSRRRASRFALPLLSSVFSKSLRDVLLPSVLWGVGIGIVGGVLLSTAEQALEPIRELARSTPFLAPLMGDITSNEAYLSVALFTYLPVILAIYSIVQIEAWASDEEEGRLEILLSAPVARSTVLIARFLAIAIGLALILTLAGVVLLTAAAALNVELSAAKVAEALVALLPVAFAVAAFGLFLSTWLKRPGPAVPITIALVAAMFFLDALGRLFNLPEEVLNLSAFHLYGRPLAEGVAWGGLLALTAVSLALCAASLIGLARRDIAK